MDNDRRDPRDRPEPDQTMSDAAAPDEPTQVDDSGAWPAQDPSAGPARDETPEPAWSSPAAEETRPWPTEAPEAGSARDESWPTSAPERSAQHDAAPDALPEAASEPAWPQDPRPESTSEAPSAEPDMAGPPGEIEAYPAEARTDEGERRGEPPPPETEAAAEPAATTTGAAATAAHGVPDAQGSIGESTQCPRCGTENRPGLSFCRECGQRLVAAGVASTVERPGAPEGTQACPRCGTHNRNGVAFCQNCGANLRGTAAGYVPPSVAEEASDVVADEERRGAILGPVVLLIGVVGLVTGYLLPFIGGGSLFDRAFGPGGYGAAFWNGYPEIESGIADGAYFGLAAPVPLFAVLLTVLAVAGFARARPGALQTLGLVVALVWSIGLVVLFLLVELAGGLGSDVVAMLRGLTPGGIILFLGSLIVLIGVLTRFGRN